jgi:hypothetical protein
MKTEHRQKDDVKNLNDGGKKKRGGDDVRKDATTMEKDRPASEADNDGDDVPAAATKDTKHANKTASLIEHTPPKSLVVVWILMAAELGFNLGTSIIAFAATVGTAYCCNEQIYLGPLPLTTTIPFFFLILTELGFLTRAILLTLFPSKFGGGSSSNTKNGRRDDTIEDGQGFEVKLQTTESEHAGDDHNDVVAQVAAATTTSSSSSQRLFCRRFFCGCLKWNAKMVLMVLNFLTLANPFFGCIIAWMLLYQSNKAESFVVLGLEGASIILHFVSVRLEGGLRTWYSKIIHSISIVPFFITVILMLVYLREGGVCYVVEEEMFKFSGCEVCADGNPPVDGMCGDTALAGTGGIFDEVQNVNIANLAALADGGAKQASYCSESTNFCWYPF